jgi:hypothetical protein
MVCLSGTPASRGLLTTTYGWVSVGIRRELIALPPSKKRLDGTKRDQTGLNRWTERLATNQKAAGSSPAERTTNYLQMVRFRFVESSRRSVRTTHLTTYLFRNRFAGRHSR